MSAPQFLALPSGKMWLPDSNILLLLLVGSWNQTWIPKFVRTKTFSELDYHTVAAIAHRFTTMATTTHILTEVSNLAGLSVNGPERVRFFESFAAKIVRLVEQDLPTAAIINSPIFTRLGLTDAAIAVAAKPHNLHVVTVDGPLTDYLIQIGVSVTHYERDIRGKRLLNVPPTRGQPKRRRWSKGTNRFSDRH